MALPECRRRSDISDALSFCARARALIIVLTAPTGHPTSNSRETALRSPVVRHGLSTAVGYFTRNDG
jgi:hypothetical protein